MIVTRGPFSLFSTGDYSSFSFPLGDYFIYFYIFKDLLGLLGFSLDLLQSQCPSTVPFHLFVSPSRYYRLWLYVLLLFATINSSETDIRKRKITNMRCCMKSDKVLVEKLSRFFPGSSFTNNSFFRVLWVNPALTERVHFISGYRTQNHLTSLYRDRTISLWVSYSSFQEISRPQC